MLCPEVSNFKAPESSFQCEKGNFEKNDCFEKINGFFYSHLITVVLPDTLTIPNSLSDSLLNDCEYYKVSELKVTNIFDAKFINSFFKKGNLRMLSVPTRIDCEDFMIITPSKVLILFLVKESYQELGLEGTLSQFSRNNDHRYIVKLNVLDVFKPGGKNYERVKTRLKNLKKFDVIINWDPPDEAICPSSVAKYFNDLNYHVTLCKPKYNSRTDYSMQVPLIDFENVDSDCSFDLTEWLGMFSLNGDLESGSLENFVTTYETPVPNQKFGQVKYLEWKGFFTSIQVQLLFQELRKFVIKEEKPWVSIYVQGFSECPLYLPEQQYSYLVNADASYTILMNSKNYILLTQNCLLKQYEKHNV